MEKIIRVPKWSKVLLYVLAGVFALLAAVMLIVILFSLDDEDKNIFFILIPGMLGFTALAVYFIQYIRKWHMIISAESITEVGVFKTNKIAMEDVKGYISDDKYLHIISASTGKKVISLSLQIDKGHELITWIQETFRNLDLEELQANEAAILQNESLGATEEERLATIERAKKVSTVFNFAGGAIVAWAFFYPYPYQLLCICACVFPIIALIPYYYSGGVIKLNELKNSGYPSMLLSLIIAPIAICIRALMDYNLLDVSNAWVPTFTIGAIYMLVLFLNKKALGANNKAERIIMIVLVAAVATGYGWGITIFVNCYYDNSTPTPHLLELTNKYISSGKSTSHNFSLEGKDGIPADTYKVDEELYDRVEIGEQVYVYEFEGKLHIPWVLITK